MHPYKFKLVEDNFLSDLYLLSYTDNLSIKTVHILCARSGLHANKVIPPGLIKTDDTECVQKINYQS